MSVQFNLFVIQFIFFSADLLDLRLKLSDSSNLLETLDVDFVSDLFLKVWLNCPCLVPVIFHSNRLLEFSLKGLLSSSK